MRFMLSKFGWERANRCIHADASELGVSPGRIPASQLWNDSCDIGVIIESDKTGKSIEFILNEKESDAMCWYYEPLRSANSPIDRVMIFND